MVRSHVLPKLATRLCRHVVVFAPSGRPTQTVPPASHAVLQLPPSEDILHSTPALPHAASTGSAGGGDGGGGGIGGAAGGACWQGQKR